MGDRETRRDADLNAYYRRRRTGNSSETGRQEQLLIDARVWAEAEVSEIAAKAANLDEVKKRVVKQAWDNFLPTHPYRSDFKLSYLEFTAALWEEGWPSLEDCAILAIQECVAATEGAHQREAAKAVAEGAGAGSGSSEYAGRPKLPGVALQRINDTENAAAQQLRNALDAYSPKNPDFVYQPVEINAGCWKVVEHLTSFAAAIFDAQACEYFKHHPALVQSSDLLLAGVGGEVVARTKLHWTRWETEIDWALRTRWTFEYYRAYVEEGNRPGSEDKKLTDHFLRRVDETISGRTRFWRESPDNAAFIAAYKESSAKSAELLAQQRRTDAFPKWQVLYHDLERTIFAVWQVRPDDVTVNHVRHALHVLAGHHDDGPVELDQISCEAYGIDYSRLITLLRESLTKVSDLSSGPKVPRMSTEASRTLPNSVSLPPSTWSKVKAISAVLKTKLNQGEDKDPVICESLQRCFDVLVEDHIEQGSNLDFALLHQALPDKVLESAVALDWLEPAWAPQNIASGYSDWFMRLLEGRIEYFEACEIGRPFGHEHQKPDFVVKPMPASDDPVIHLLTNPVPPIETQPSGQVVYADETKEPARAVATVGVPDTALAAWLNEALSQTSPSDSDASVGVERNPPKLNVTRIKTWIGEEGWTNSTLATRLRVSERVISSMRNNGEYHGTDAVTKLANLMNLDPGDLYLP